ncbi:hypothetical protein BC827DRAFT_1224456 [Russula dissimulans]|nr:hypothetical protein BC827DRAFT_1224456 [Russula dissimulans]
MLAHSPPFPLIIDLLGEHHDISARVEEGIMLALQQRRRVRRIRLGIPVPKLQKLMMAIDGEFPILDYLYIRRPIKHGIQLILPEAFRAPRLQSLVLFNVFFPIGSPLFATATSLVTLSLQNIPSSAYFNPNGLFHCLARMPRLETLRITFQSPLPNRDTAERRSLPAPNMACLVLLNLRWIEFGGSSAYLEALLPWMATPLLERLHILLFDQFISPVPSLLPFMNAVKNFRFSCAGFRFHEGGVAAMLGRDELGINAFIHVFSRRLDWQVASVAQIFNANTLGPALSGVENLSLDYRERSSSSPPQTWHGETDRAQWRGLLRSFNNAKTLRVHRGLVAELARCLQVDDGESPTELIPGLAELAYHGSGVVTDRDVGDKFARFVRERQIAGRPVTLVRSK